MSAIDGGPRSATVVALEPVEVDAASATDFLAFLEEHPRVAGELLQLVVARLRTRRLDKSSSERSTRWAVFAEA